MFIQRGNNNFNIEIADAPSFLNTKSLLFDGVDDYVQTSASTSGDITLSAWVDCNGTYTAFSSQYAVSIRTGNTPNATLGRLFKQGASLWVALQMYDQNGANFSTYTARGVLLEGAGWKHLCWTYDNTTKQIYLYINGVAQTWTSYNSAITTPYLTAPPTSNYNSPLFMGAYNNLGSSPFNGNVDEVCLLDRIATLSEIATLSTAPTVDLTSLNPIAWYRNGDNGAWKSPQWLIPNNENKDKASNYSFDFDGVDDRIDTTSIDLGLENTISFWAKRNGTNFNGAVWGGIVQSNYYTVFLTSANSIFYRVGGGANTFNDSDIISAVGADAWFHCALVRNNSGADVLCYINGVLKQTITGIVGSANNTIVKNIGSRGPTPLDFEITGFLDEMSLFNSALSASQINDIYNSGEPTTISGALAHWKMGDNSTYVENVNPDGTWTIPDEVGTNDGTSNNLMADSARVGDAPSSTNNAVSYNMDEVDRVTDVPT